MSLITNTSYAPWEYVPDEILLLSFANLNNPRDVLACACVDKRWHVISGDNLLWDKFYQRAYKQSPLPEISSKQQYLSKRKYMACLGHSYFNVSSLFPIDVKYRAHFLYSNRSELSNISAISEENKIYNWDIDANSLNIISPPDDFGELLSAEMLGRSHLVTLRKDRTLMIEDIQNNKIIYTSAGCSSGFYEYKKPYYWVVKTNPHEAHLIDLNDGNTLVTIPAGGDQILDIKLLKNDHYLVQMGSGVLQIWRKNIHELELIALTHISNPQSVVPIVNCNDIIIYETPGKINFWNYIRIVKKTSRNIVAEGTLGIQCIAFDDGDIFAKKVSQGILVDGKTLEVIKRFPLNLNNTNVKSAIALDNRHVMMIDTLGAINILDLENLLYVAQGNLGQGVNLWRTQEGKIVCQGSNRYFCLKINPRTEEVLEEIAEGFEQARLINLVCENKIDRQTPINFNRLLVDAMTRCRNLPNKDKAGLSKGMLKVLKEKNLPESEDPFFGAEQSSTDLFELRALAVREYIKRLSKL